MERDPRHNPGWEGRGQQWRLGPSKCLSKTCLQLGLLWLGFLPLQLVCMSCVPEARLWERPAGWWLQHSLAVGKRCCETLKRAATPLVAMCSGRVDCESSAWLKCFIASTERRWLYVNLLCVCLCVCVFSLLLKQALTRSVWLALGMSHRLVFIPSAFSHCFIQSWECWKEPKEPSPSSFQMGSHLIGSCFCGSQLGYVKALKETHWSSHWHYCDSLRYTVGASLNLVLPRL